MMNYNDQSRIVMLRGTLAFGVLRNARGTGYPYGMTGPVLILKTHNQGATEESSGA